MLSTAIPSSSTAPVIAKTRFRNRSSGQLVDSIWRELRLNGIWRGTDFEAHEANTLAGAGDRSEWMPVFAKWLPIESGQVWCNRANRVLDPVHVPLAGDGSLKDFLEAAEAFFASFGNRKIGVQLSGGLDSSLIIGLLRHFGIRHGLVGLRANRYEFRTEQYVQDLLAAQNSEVELIAGDSCLPCSRLRSVPPHQTPDILSINYAQDRDMADACTRLGIEVLLSGGGGDNLLGQAVPNTPSACEWRPQTFTDSFPVEMVYRPLGIEFCSFFGDLGVVNAIYRLRCGQPDDFRKVWARSFFRKFLPDELVNFHYCADFWGRSIDGLIGDQEEIREIHHQALQFSGNSYFTKAKLEALLAQDLYRPSKELYQRIEARVSSAVWICSLVQWLEKPAKCDFQEKSPIKIVH